MPRTRPLTMSGMLLLSVLAACKGASQVADTPENRSTAARAVARVEIECGGLDKVLDQGADWGLSYSTEELQADLGRELTPDEALRVRAIMRASLAEILTPARWEQILTEVYSQSFTALELEEIRTFFTTAAGRKVLQIEASLSERIEAAGDAVFDEHLEEFITQVDERLAGEFGELAGETP